MSYPILILIRGVPGSGKSYVASALAKALGDDLVVMLDPDATDYSSKEYIGLSAALTADEVDKKFHPYRFLRAQAYQGITSDKIIIWNQAFTNLDGFNKTVLNLRTYAADHGTRLPVLVVELSVDEKTARQRVARRAGQGGHDVADDAFQRFLTDYTSFADQGYRVVSVNGEDDVAVSVAKIRSALTQLKEDPES